MNYLFKISLFSIAIIFSSFCLGDGQVLQLSKTVTKRKTIPNKYKNDTTVVYLKLRPPIEKSTNWGNGVCMNTYEKGKLQNLPDWIINFKCLKAIDLIGNNDFQITEEIVKIEKLTNLEYLAFSISKIDIELVNELSKLKQLHELHILTSVDDDEKQLLDHLKLNLPNCKIGASVFADYGDAYFTKDK